MTVAYPWRAVEGGLLVSVRLTPKGGRDVIDGIERRADGSIVLKVRVRPPAHDNAANDALTALIASTLGVAASRVRLVSGSTARDKTLRIEGDAAALARTLASTSAVEELAS